MHFLWTLFALCLALVSAQQGNLGEGNPFYMTPLAMTDMPDPSPFVSSSSMYPEFAFCICVYICVCVFSSSSLFISREVHSIQ